MQNVYCSHIALRLFYYINDVFISYHWLTLLLHNIVQEFLFQLHVLRPFAYLSLRITGVAYNTSAQRTWALTIIKLLKLSNFRFLHVLKSAKIPALFFTVLLEGAEANRTSLLLSLNNLFVQHLNFDQGTNIKWFHFSPITAFNVLHRVSSHPLMTAYSVPIAFWSLSFIKISVQANLIQFKIPPCFCLKYHPFPSSFFQQSFCLRDLRIGKEWDQLFHSLSSLLGLLQRTRIRGRERLQVSPPWQM